MNVEVEIAKLKATQKIHQGMVEIMFSYIDKKLGHDDLFNFIKTIKNSSEFTEDAIFVAQKMTDLELSFGPEVFHEKIPVQ